MKIFDKSNKNDYINQIKIDLSVHSNEKVDLEKPLALENQQLEGVVADLR